MNLYCAPFNLHCKPSPSIRWTLVWCCSIALLGLWFSPAQVRSQTPITAQNTAQNTGLSISESDLAAIERDRERAIRAMKAKNPQGAARILEPWNQKYPAHLGLANDYAIALTQLGRLDDASKSLESAFLNNPESQEAFENLRQILSRQAAVFYAKAVGRPSPSSPLALKGDPLAVQPVARVAPPALAAAEPPTAAVKESPPTSVASVAAPRTNSSAAPTTSSPSTDTRVLRDALTLAAERWAAAWESKNFEAYLAAYSDDFQPQKFPSREAWVEHRRPRVTRPGPLVVRVSDLRIKPLPSDRVEVKLRQTYEASGTKLNSVKTLVFANEKGEWKILREDGR